MSRDDHINSVKSVADPGFSPGGVATPNIQGTEHQQYLSTIEYWTEVSRLVHPPWEQVRSNTYLW